MAIRAVIWDLGGVLVRTQDPEPRTRAAERLGLTRAELERIVFAGEWSDRATLGAISSAELWQNIGLQFKLSSQETNSLEHAFWEGDCLDRELVGYIRGLRPQHRTALLSNAFLGLRSGLERWSIADAFDQVIISSEVGLMKPDPRIFELAVRRLEVDPAEAVFVDDFSLNVRAARSQGLYAVKFLDPEQAKADLQRILESTE
jgi:epoxide hydrolase-like predicted phosphatase